MKTLVQVNIYRWRDGQLEFLLLKRIQEEDGFWQPVTGHMEAGETVADTLKREVIEETGIHKFKDLTDQLYSYEWYSDDQDEARGVKGRDIVFGAEVRPETEVTLNPKEHDEYEWLPYDEALRRLKWQGNKESLRRLYERLQQQQTTPVPDDDYSVDPGF